MMTYRPTLADLITTLRGLTDTEVSQYTIGGVAYWTPEQVQIVLDRHRTDVLQEPLTYREHWAGGGTVQYLEYTSRHNNFEATLGGTAIFIVEDSLGDNVGTASYSVDYQRGVITFTADTTGTDYYLTARSYDINAAAADIWRQKAAHYAAAYDIRTDNHGLTRSQLMKQAIEMSKLYHDMGPPDTVGVIRSDVMGWNE